MSSFPTPHPAFPPRRIAVIGGGISGLAAAHRMTELLPQAELELFEASSRLGGVLHTIERNGFLIEQAADNFLVKPPAGIELCRHLGIADDLLTTDETRRRAFVVRAGKLVPIPEGFYLMSPRKLWPLLKSPALSIAGKLRLLIEPFIGLRKPFPVGREQGEADDESVASFARRRLGREAFERLVQPLVAGIYTADPEQLSMAATLPQFLEYERMNGSLLRATLGQSTRSEVQSENASGARYGLFVAPRSGMTSFVDAIARRLPRTIIHLDTQVLELRFGDNRWQLHRRSDSGTSQSDFDAVVLALPAHAAAGVLGRFDAELSREVATIEYASCAVVSLGFERCQVGHALDGFGFVVPQSERRRIIAGSFASLKFAGRAAADQVLIRVFIGGAVQRELLELSDGELTRIAREELKELLQVIGEPLVTDVARWPRSMPQYHVGHLARVERIEQLSAKHARFALAGNAYRGVGIPQCIASGQAAAERVSAEFV